MNWIDGHLDLAYIALDGRNLLKPCPDDSGCISFPDLKAGGVSFAFATIFTEPDPDDAGDPCGYPRDDREAAHRAGMVQLEYYQRLESKGEIKFVRTRADLPDERSPDDAMRILLLMEGADPIRSPEEVAQWHEQGLRMVGMAWSKGTRYTAGNRKSGPLTPLGIELVGAMDEAGIIHDASHLADDALDGLLEHAKGRIVATHSNCRALMEEDNQRHLRDDQIKAIGERDGIIGLNLFSVFLIPEGRAAIEDCVNHVERICSIMGHRRGVALGSDADGGFGPDKLPVDLDHPRKYGNLLSALSNVGWSEEDLNAFASGNWLRLLNESLT